VAALPAAVGAVRTAVRRSLQRLGLPAGSLILVACSGGADSLALAAEAAFVAPRIGLAAGLVTINHGLQSGSADRAGQLVAWAATVGLAPAIACAVDATPHGDGPEAAARSARYRALAAAAKQTGAVAVLLGHTLDDQAETVLLALTRGSGPRGIAAMPEVRDQDGVRFVRPLLRVPRRQTVAACADLGLKPWQDPHNDDPAYARSRLRAAMPALTEVLGDDVVTNLARTARLVAADAELLDRLADDARPTVTGPEGGLIVSALSDLPAPLRTRILRSFALDAGAGAAALGSVHIEALDALITDWHGQGPVGLPGGVRIGRRGDLLLTRRVGL